MFTKLRTALLAATLAFPASAAFAQPITLDQAMEMVETGQICDGKTILLLMHAKLHRLVD